MVKCAFLKQHKTYLVVGNNKIDNRLQQLTLRICWALCAIAAATATTRVVHHLFPHLREHDSPPIHCAQSEVFRFVDTLQMASQTAISRARREGPVDVFCRF